MLLECFSERIVKKLRIMVDSQDEYDDIFSCSCPGCHIASGLLTASSPDRYKEVQILDNKQIRPRFGGASHWPQCRSLNIMFQIHLFHHHPIVMSDPEIPLSEAALLKLESESEKSNNLKVLLEGNADPKPLGSSNSSSTN